MKISGFFDYFDTEGFSRTIEQRYPFSGAILYDSLEALKMKREKTDLNLKLSYNNLEIKGKYMHKRREGVYRN